MRASVRTAVALATFFLVWGAPAPVGATKAVLLPFEELVVRADFVGVVECEVAGGIVAKYKVVESWRGPKAGERFSLRMAVDYWGPQYPVALCGQRFLVTAYHTHLPDHLMSVSVGGPVPLWWRDLPADYRIPFAQGKYVPDDDRRKQVQALLTGTPAEQDLALLRGLVENLPSAKKSDKGDPEAEIRKRLLGHKSADELLAAVEVLAKGDAEAWKYRAGYLKNLLDEARRRRAAAEKGGTEAPPPRPRPEEKEPTAAELERLHKAFDRGAEDRAFQEAFEKLTRHDPAPVVEYLVRWQGKREAWRNRDRAHGIGSYFAWKCGKDRVKHLTALLGAKDPFIRVAGAVYLCYEDRDSGMAALRKLTALEGEPGAWAALTLARRGDKAAVPRALEVFRAKQPVDKGEFEPGMAEVLRRNLQGRLSELLSNSAAAAKAPQPPFSEKEAHQFDELLKWWRANEARVTPQDPWLPLLERQKID